MIEHANQILQHTREGLAAFWQGALQTEWERDRLFLPYPLMLPDGLQLVFELRPHTATNAILSDGGRILSRLAGEGLTLDSEATGRILDDKLAFYALERDGFELRRPLGLPADPVAIQLFAEGLVAIAHLINRHDPEPIEESVARRSLERIFTARNIQPRRNYALQGQVEKMIRASYFVEQGNGLALEVVDRKSNIHGYMQQWGWRWNDLKAVQPKIVRAMIYDPDRQDWDTTALEIGRSVCDVFCPYHDSNQIDNALTQARGSSR